MAEKILRAKTTDGEGAEFYLHSLVKAKWNTDGDTLRLPASDIGNCDIIAETIQTSDDAIEIDKLRAERDALKGELGAALKAWRVSLAMLSEARAERDALKAEVERTMEVLQDAINQACVDGRGVLDHGCVSAYEDALIFLLEKGRVKLSSDNGNGYTWVKGGDA